MTRVIVHDKDQRLAVALLDSISQFDVVERVDIAVDTKDLRGLLELDPGRLLVLGPGMEREDLAKLQGSLRDFSTLVTIWVTDRLEADPLKTAMRHGIRDVVAVDDLTSELPQAIRRLEHLLRPPAPEPQATSSGRGKVVVVCGPKGGTGKTFLATNLAVATQRAGISTVLFDARPNFGDCAGFLRVRPAHSWADLADAATVDDSLVRSVLSPHGSGLNLLCAPTDPSAGAADADLVEATVRVLRSLFDLVVVDTAPGSDEMTRAALQGSDSVLLVTSLDVPAIKDARLCLRSLEQLQVDPGKVRVVLNRGDSKVGFPGDEVKRALGRSVSVSIPSGAAVPRSINEGVPLVESSPKDRSAKSVLALARDLQRELSLTTSVAVEGQKARRTFLRARTASS